VIAHACLGDADGARAVLAAHGDALAPAIRDALAHAIDDPPPLITHRFPEHAKLAWEAVKPMVDGGRYAEAEPLLRRAAAWDPELLELTGDLGYCLSKLGKDDEAIAVYDAALARGATPVLRMNRGNCRLRTKRYAGAIEDFRACVELKPDWHDARTNLVSALFASGEVRGARAELDRLRSLGAPAAHVRSLEQMIAQAR
jgi:Flp pilus assembly protein TadD